MCNPAIAPPLQFWGITIVILDLWHGKNICSCFNLLHLFLDPFLSLPVSWSSATRSPPFPSWWSWRRTARWSRIKAGSRSETGAWPASGPGWTLQRSFRILRLRKQNSHLGGGLLLPYEHVALPKVQISQIKRIYCRGRNNILVMQLIYTTFLKC